MCAAVKVNDIYLATIKLRVNDMNSLNASIVKAASEKLTIVVALEKSVVVVGEY